MTARTQSTESIDTESQTRGVATAGTALLLSLLLHGALLGAIALHFLDPAPAPSPEAAIPIEIVALEEPEKASDPLAETATLEPLEPVAAPEPEPELPAGAAHVPLPEPDPPVVPEPEPDLLAEAEPAPIPEPEAEPEAIPTAEPAPPVETEDIAEAVPEIAEDIAPEPEVESAPDEEIEVAPGPQIVALPPPPLPDRKPEPADAAPTESAPPAASLETAVTVPEPEPKPEPIEQAEAPPAAEPALQESETPAAPKRLTTPTTPQGLLANLAALTDEAARAKADPELWAIVTAVREQIRQCWLLSPEETQEPALSVEIAVAFEKDGRLLRADIQDTGRMVRDQDFKDIAVGAQRALRSCSPFDLPAEHYAIWKSFTLRFVPHEPT